MDIGDMTGNFIKRFETNDKNQNVRKVICELMNFPEIEHIQMFNDCRGLIERFLEPHINLIRVILNEIGKFSSAIHIIYKRFKHAGIPIIPSKPVRSIMQTPSPLDKFQSINIIPFGTNPFIDIKIIPFSTKILKKYEQLVGKIQRILDIMITNKITCIERNMPGVFPMNYYLILN